MNLRDALIAGSEHGTDRLSVEADRRLRVRLGLESARAASPRRVWMYPALGALAAAAVIIIFLQTRPTSETSTVATAAGFVDASKQRWDGTLTADSLDVRGTVAATVTWQGASITAAPGTKLTSRPDGGLVLAEGSIQIQRSDVKPMIVDVPMGRAVFASYRSSIKADRESVTLVLDDGTGHFTDAGGQTHPLVPGTVLVLPVVRTGSAEGSSAPMVVPSAPPPTKKPARANLAPGETPTVTETPRPPGLTPTIVRPDTPCTFKSDCDPGATCRKNEHGASVCMGNGGEGAACWFHNDCTSNLCVSRRCAP